MNGRFLPWFLAWLALPGCLDLFDDLGDDKPAPRRPPVPPRADAPPHIVSIDVPDWPPLGPLGEVNVQVEDDCCLELVRFTFREEVSRPTYGSSARVTVFGDELGEGMGTLWVDAKDRKSQWATREVQNLLVDLSPPTAQVGETWLPATGANVEIWAADAYVLGRVTLEFQSVSVEQTLPEGFPATFGVAWDQSLELFPTDAFPPGRGEATLTVTDAAGNATVQTFELVLDGTPPEVLFVSPAADSEVSGRFEVALAVKDDLEGAEVALYAGGAFLGVAPGPEAVITLDAADLPAGAVELTAIALDRAGNASAPVQLTVEVPLTPPR